MQIEPGATIAHYEILAPIGKGGMGEVYRARDTKLGREVALKILPVDVASDTTRLERFRQEARALAALDHPNIVTVHSVEEEGGIQFLTMGLAKGRSLEEVEREGPLSVPALVDAALQLTDALGAAHDNGVIHRDLKPANVMVADDGRVTILDFGLAKMTESDPEDDETAVRTREGIVMGTAPYMSPEQVQGLRIDHRSDLFSLGILLHEMATGKRPFRGDNSASLCSAILRDDPPRVTEVDPSLPETLANVIDRCLRKNVADRYQRAAEVHEALHALKDDSSPAVQERREETSDRQEKHVLVLPFVNRSSDPDNEYFSDGLTEEVISDLTKVLALRVISRNSAMTLKGTTKDTRTLAEDLGVSHLVTGSVRRAGNALRVTAELVDAQTDTPIWSDKFSGTMDDVFGIQEEISRKIVSALEVKLTESEERQVAERPIEDTVAWDCYLRARQEMYGWTIESSRRARQLVDEALEIVGEIPLLLATKGQIHWNEVNASLAPAEEGLARASELAERALELDSDLPLAIYVRGIIAGMRGQPESALPDLYRAHELAPNDANLIAELCRFSNVSGLRHHGPFVERIIEIDPLTPVSQLVPSSYHWVMGHRDQIALPARRSIELAPEASMLHLVAGWQIAAAGHHDEAREILDRTAADLAKHPVGLMARFLERSLAGDADGALAHATPEMTAAMRNEFTVVFLADAFALIGKTDESLEWLSTAIRYGFTNHPFFVENDPFLEGVRHEQGFRELMSNLKPRWEALVEWERQGRPASIGR